MKVAKTPGQLQWQPWPLPPMSEFSDRSVIACWWDGQDDGTAPTILMAACMGDWWRLEQTILNKDVSSDHLDEHDPPSYWAFLGWYDPEPGVNR